MGRLLSAATRWNCYWVAGALFALAACLTLSGCGGCRAEVDEDAEQARHEETLRRPRPDLELLSVATPALLAGQPSAAIKPGHWTPLSLTLRAHNHDFQGRLALEPVDQQGRPLRLLPLQNPLRFSRRLTVPKNQSRRIESAVWAPVPAPAVHFSVRIDRAGGARLIDQPNRPLGMMPDHQYQMIVLSRQAEEYSFLRLLPTVANPDGIEELNTSAAHYLVSFAPREGPVPLPDQALLWTPIAWLVWDDFDPQRLSAAQQQALLDWLHWGGQMLVSGPGSLDGLRSSFLEPYLAATGGEAVSWEADAMAPLARMCQDPKRWNFEDPWPGQRLVPSPLAEQPPLVSAVDGQPLLVERFVGRGRVVVSAFRLQQHQLQQWAGCDELFHGVLLRRPARVFEASELLQPVVSWARVPQNNHRSPSKRYRPDYNTRLRYFTRDGSIRRDAAAATLAAIPPHAVFGTTTAEYFADQGIPAGGGGVAAWNDNSEASTLANAALREAAGIVVPPASTVLAVLAAYLLVLVPLNWAVFRLLGRLEWAWAVIPAIAVGFALLVVRLAELDIGFARAQTEIGVVEAMAGYDRAHATRYVALYNSLGTRYTVDLHDPEAVCLPFAPRSALSGISGSSAVVLDRVPADNRPLADALRIENFVVGSNSTSMLHAETILELGGSIQAERLDERRWRIANHTRFTWHGLHLWNRQASAWIGTLESGAGCEVELVVQAADIDEQLATAFHEGQPPAAVTPHLLPLVGLARDAVQPYGTRLIGFSSEPLPDLSVRPVAAQRRVANLLVVHLEYEPPQPPERDRNTAGSVVNQLNRPRGAAP